MRVVVQRVREAAVRVDDGIVGRIGPGMVVLLGCETTDSAEDVEWLVNKLASLRIFDDEGGVMNRALAETAGEILLISQFTLIASTRKGARPSWHRAAKPEVARPLFEAFHHRLQGRLGRSIPTGVFGASMTVSLENDGPVTLIIDSRLRE